MVKITLNEEGRAVPSLLCDNCLDFIDDAGLALVLWKRNNKHLPDAGKVYFTHKKCEDDFKKGEVWGDMELNQFLRRLIHNIKADISENMGTDLLDDCP